ncbi:ground-like domain protein [Ancylostoma caninum]|uniref:Ground-like domain protein n=1 Tax=Ancylostoma caninum TaxID=29170 RepID=A0A368GG95_ANCCA|nr:ground-like domain protein [Ancylostoma caninum]
MFWLLAALLPASTLAFGFGGCGCALPPPPPLCLPPIQLPPICPPIPPPCICPPPVICNPCACGRKKREALPPVAEIVGSDDRKCNNEQLREIIVNGIKTNQREAKSLIHSEVRKKLGGNWVVVCAPEPVSFVTQSQQYCLDGQDGTWCYAFKIN